MIVKTGDTWNVDIYVATDKEAILNACREYVKEGACVSVIPCKYIYTGGEEDGYKITFIHYQRFPIYTYRISLREKALALAEDILNNTSAKTLSVVTPDETYYIAKDES
jgi:hypothetical protein